jgi:putative photosynthetic complex assembly protein
MSQILDANTLKSRRNPAFPRFPLFGAILLVGFCIAATYIGKTYEIATVRNPVAVPNAVRDLRFTQLADGDLLLSDARTEETIVLFQPDEGGFVRGSLRAFLQERKVHRAPLDAPFRLILWDNGRLTLSDTVTGQRFPLDAFGSTNSSAFLRLLNKESGL